MTIQDDVKILRLALEDRWGAPHQALNRIEAALPKPRTLKDQFEEYPIGTRFHLGRPEDMQFIKVGERAMVRVYTTWDNKVITEYWDNMFTEGVYAHWAFSANGDNMRKLT